MANNTFNAANEWTDRRIAKAGTDKDEYDYTYDAVGNLTGESLTLTRGGGTANSSRTFVYDVFGRLVEVNVPGTEEGPVVIARYRYNGLGMRIMWQDDADADSTLESSERFYVCHDERWRPVGTFRDTDASPKEAFVYHAAGQGGFGGSSYIDSVILRDRDNYTSTTPNPMTSEADGTLEERRFYCQNWRADVVAITKSDGTPWEYVRYSSYGEPTVYPVADLNMDGVVNSADDTEYSNLLYSSASGAVFADSDIDADGLDGWTGADTDLFYESYAANVGKSGKGRVSSPGVGNRKGYAAYEWDQVIRASHVRYRVYFPEIGRWGRRDPIGYVDGMSLYQYVSDMALLSIDPLGLGKICYRPMPSPPIPVTPPLWIPPMLLPNPLRAIPFPPFISPDPGGPLPVPDIVTPPFTLPGITVPRVSVPSWVWPALPIGPFLVPLSMWPEHEHIYFEDGGFPPNIGFCPNGVRPDSPGAPTPFPQWLVCEGGYNDGLLRAASRYCALQPRFKSPGSYRLFGNNCQDYAECVRRRYRELESQQKKSWGVPWVLKPFC